jgi:hypothetical protein
VDDYIGLTNSTDSDRSDKMNKLLDGAHQDAQRNLPTEKTIISFIGGISLPWYGIGIGASVSVGSAIVIIGGAITIVGGVTILSLEGVEYNSEHYDDVEMAGLYCGPGAMYLAAKNKENGSAKNGNSGKPNSPKKASKSQLKNDLGLKNETDISIFKNDQLGSGGNKTSKWDIYKDTDTGRYWLGTKDGTNWIPVIK